MFPPCTIYVKRGQRIGDDEAEQPQTVVAPAVGQVRSQSAALWVRNLTRVSDAGEPEWLIGFVEAYAEWTAKANGLGFEPRAEIDSRVDEWNRAFYPLLASAFVRMEPEIAATEAARVVAVPDRSFFDIASEFIPAVDRLYFDRLGLEVDVAIRLRRLVAERLLHSVGWWRERDRSELSVERGIGPAIGVLFFNQYDSFQGAQCYLRAGGIDQVDPFLPQLTSLIEDGPVPFTALLTMNLLEVSSKPEHMRFFLSSALTWLRREPSNTLLWVDGGLGARLAKWMNSVTASELSLRSATHPLRTQMDDVLARLVQVGVPEAHRLERVLASDDLRESSV
jgi:hypothetical protein